MKGGRGERRSALLGLLLLAGCSGPPTVSRAPSEATLTFLGAGARPQPQSRSELESAIPSEIVDGWDPYYKRPKRFRCLSLRAVLERGFPGVELGTEELLLRARDGYVVSIGGARLLDPAAYLAVADVDVANWEPIGPRRADPAPYYLVWKGDDKQNLESYPRPWALGAIERARFEALYPHVLPPVGSASPLLQRGYSIFRRECIRCHAMNREGGRIGPDLNVPQSIVEYRPLAQIRDYIRDPLRFRYGAMPAHPYLSEIDLDGLIEYFQVMRAHKHDREGAARSSIVGHPSGHSDGRL